MKKLLSMLLVFTMALSLAACGDEGETETEEKEVDAALFDASPYCDENGYYKDVKANDYVDLILAEGIQIPYDSYNVTEAELDEELNAILEENKTEKQVTDRAVADGDSVNIDYVGSVDGTEFEGGNTNGQGTLVTIGVTSYIDNFLEQLIGHKPGETFDINVTFPDDYGKEELNGKPAVFKTTINYISEEVVPELNDEFVLATFTAKGYKTVEELKAGTVESLKKNKIQNYIYSYLADNSPVSEIPTVVNEYWKEYFKWQIETRAAYYQVDVEEFYEANGFTSFDEYFQAMAETVTSYANQDLIIQAVAEKLKYDPTEDDIKEFFLEDFGTEDYTTVTGNINQTTLNHTVLSSLIMKKLVNSAVLLKENETESNPKAEGSDTSSIEDLFQDKVDK